MNNFKKLLIIGPILPPIGGISIHIDRFTKLFNDDFQIEFIDESREIKKEIFNIRNLNFAEYYRRIRSADIIFIHSVTRIQRYFHLIAGIFTKAKVVFSLHTYPKSPGFPYAYSDRLIFNLADRIILVNPKMKPILNIPERKIFIKHAFLPPVLEKEENLSANLYKRICNAKSERRTIIASNGWKLEFFDGNDMYGLDLCIRAVHFLKAREIPVFFVFNVSTIDGVEQYYKSCQKEIERLGITESFHLINEKLSFVKLIEVSDITVRSTNTDGDSLSVRESLFFHKPVVASDIIERPAGTILFKTRDDLDLANKLETCIRHSNHTDGESGEGLSGIKAFYENVLNF